jgi:hypothetical protein
VPVPSWNTGQVCRKQGEGVCNAALAPSGAFKTFNTNCAVAPVGAFLWVLPDWQGYGYPLLLARPVLQVGAYGYCKPRMTAKRCGTTAAGFRKPIARSASNSGRSPQLPSRPGPGRCLFVQLDCLRRYVAAFDLRCNALDGAGLGLSASGARRRPGSEGPQVHGFIVDERLAKPWQSRGGEADALRISHAP